jgi:hypothetical protein
MTSNKKYICALILLIAFHMLGNYAWWQDNNAITGIDAEQHALFQLKVFDFYSGVFKDSTLSILEKARILASHIRNIHEGKDFRAVRDIEAWPQFLHFFSSLFLIFGRSLQALRFSMLPFFVILIVSTYGIGRKIYNPASGLLAAWLVSFYPMVFESSRHYNPDFPLTAIVALCVLLLLHGNAFSSLRYSVFFGIILGIGTHIKGQALFFVLPVVIGVFVVSVLSPMRYSLPVGKRAFNMVLSFFITLLISSIWWFHRLPATSYQLLDHIGLLNTQSIIASSSNSGPYSLPSLMWYVRSFFLNTPGVILFVFFLCALPLWLKSSCKHKLEMLLWALVPLVLFSFIFVIKQTRYIMPILPVIAIISACGIYNIKNKLSRYTIVGFMLLFGFFQYAGISYAFGKFHEHPWGKARFITYNSYETPRYYRQFYTIDKMIDKIRAEIPYPQKVYAAYLSHSRSIAYFFSLKDKNIEVWPVSADYPDYHEYAEDFQFVIAYVFVFDSIINPSELETANVEEVAQTVWPELKITTKEEMARIACYHPPNHPLYEKRLSYMQEFLEGFEFCYESGYALLLCRKKN